MQVLTISGSLRATSSNRNALEALEMIAPAGVRVEHYQGLGELPHFNPDLDAEGMIPPASVASLRNAVRAADAVMICSPEYAHGLPGSLKNALDWLVSEPDLPGKRVGVLNLSPRSTHADASLREILTTMSTQVVAEASLTLPLAGRRLDPQAMVADPALRSILTSSLSALIAAV